MLNICHHSCAYTVLQNVQNNAMCSAAYVTMHHREPLLPFSKSRAWSWLLVSSCRDIATMCRKLRETIISLTLLSVFLSFSLYICIIVRQPSPLFCFNPDLEYIVFFFAEYCCPDPPLEESRGCVGVTLGQF